MKLDCILTATNENPLYIEFIPIFIKAWKGLVPEADVKIVMVASEIPEQYKKYSDYIILFPPIESVSTSLTAQYIRILYPALLPYENGVLITDMDMLPMSRSYYTDTIQKYDNTKFIYYRHVLFFDRQIAMCYNIATPQTWSEIFNITKVEDIIKELVNINSQINYSGVPGESEWFSDQLKLYDAVMKWNAKTNGFVFMKDWETGFNRLDRIGNFNYNQGITYSDFHAMRPYSKYKEINDKVIDSMLSNYSFISKSKLQNNKMYLVYSCVFFQWNYINLLNLLLKSYALTEDKKDITYLAICHPQFKEHIENLFESLNIDGKIWCLELTTLFEAGYSRLFIFDYPEVNNYKKILYLDTDIIINKNLTIILNRNIGDKLYAMREGDTNSIYHGSQFFTDSNPNVTTFTSAILLFNNCAIIKNLFKETLNHIKQYLSAGNPVPGCLDQPFIVYNAVIRNLHDNKLIDEYADGIVDSYNNKVLSHFPCGPGNYGDKVERMANFLRIIMEKRVDENNYLLNKKYTWQNSIIEFLPNGKMNAFGTGVYKYINVGLVKADFGGREHFFRFSDDHKTFISIRKNDFDSVKGHLI